MDQIQPFNDERLTGFCVYCGGPTETRDHVPSRVLLDEPYPENLPFVPACQDCNASFAPDEEYLACLVECVLCGSSAPEKIQRPKVRDILRHSPRLGERIERARTERDGAIVFEPEMTRVRNVVLKLARGHAAYELSEPQLDEPSSVSVLPLSLMTDRDRVQFESFSDFQSGHFAGWPEVWSRAFIRACGIGTGQMSGGWIIVQEGRYRYRCEAGAVVRFVISEYLAAGVVW